MKTKKIISLLLVLFLSAICFGVAITSDPWLGGGWNVAAPNNESLSGNTYKELQDLRKGVGIRMTKEHIAFAPSSVGGEHRPGGCSILFYDNTAAIDANVTGDAFVHDGLIYDTTLLQFFTMNAAEDAKVAILIGTAGIADSNVTIGKINFFVDEDNMASNSAVKVPSQQSVKAYSDSGTQTMTNKTLTAPVLTSPVLNTGLSGTAFLDEDDMASDSATKVASQQSIKKYVDDQIVTAKTSAFNPTTMAGASDSIGTVTLPNGLIMKWGTVSRTGTDTTVTFAAAFPNACFQVISCGAVYGGSGVASKTLSTTGCVLVCRSSEETSYRYFAIGR